MMPVDALMKEHRQIARLVPLLEKELRRLDAGGAVNPSLIILIVDYFRTYADRCHHGKEEDILFRALAAKPLSEEHRRTMNRLIEEHVYGRALVGRMLLDQERCVKGEKDALTAMKQEIRELAELYPRHIGTENRHFFPPSMEYLSAEEQAAMMKAFTEFDAKLVHEKYESVIEELEAALGVTRRKAAPMADV